MKICNATGNGVCVNCDGIPPKINGDSCGDICRYTAQNIIDEITEYSRVVIYNRETNKFYSTYYWDGDEFNKTIGDWEITG